MEPESNEGGRVDAAAVTVAITGEVMKQVQVAFDLHEQRLEAIVEAQEQRFGQRTLSRVLTIKETARRMNVSVRTVNEWLRTNSLAHFRMGRVVRIQLSDLHEFWGRHYLFGRKNSNRGRW